MKIRIERFSPHQTAKTIAVVLAVGSIVAMVPMFLVMLLVGAPSGGGMHGGGFPIGMTVLMPIGYLIFGYIMTVVAAFVYNVMARYVGGIEFEGQEQS